MPTEIRYASDTKIHPNSPFADPATCPTHIEVDGYGRVPINIVRKTLWSNGYTVMKPNVHERVLYTRPANAADMVHHPQPTTPSKMLGMSFLAGLGGAALAMGIAIAATMPLCGVLLAVSGVLTWILSAANIMTSIAPDLKPNRLANTQAKIPLDVAPFAQMA